MYTDLLSRILDDGVEEPTGSALVEYALVCREEMWPSVLHPGGSASMALGAQVSYDRALIKLCTANDVAMDVPGFSQPAAERARLEQELATLGIDLARSRQAARP